MVGPVELFEPLAQTPELERAHAWPPHSGDEGRRYEGTRVRDEGSPLHVPRITDRRCHRHAMERNLETHLGKRDTEHRLQDDLLARVRKGRRRFVLPAP